jgi:hypothetical protein
MRTFHRVDDRRAKPAPNTKAEQRLPIGQSMALITGLSVLSWGVIILIAVAIRAVV